MQLPLTRHWAEHRELFVMDKLSLPGSRVCVLILLTSLNLNEALLIDDNQRNVSLVWPTSCGQHTTSQPKGFVVSPVQSAHNRGYGNNTSCIWHLKLRPGTITTLSFAYLDIEETLPCLSPPCCSQNWVYMMIVPGSASPHKTRQLCGQKPPPPIITTGQGLVLKFYANLALKSGKGFRIDYISQKLSLLEDGVCKADEFRCASGKCILQSWQCNGWDECGDKSDEEGCPECPVGYASCAKDSNELTECYDPALQRCDGTWDCALGRDELGCANCKHDEAMCIDGRGCFRLAQMCNGYADCLDKTDELDSRCGLYNLTEDVVADIERKSVWPEQCHGNLLSCGPPGECFDPVEHGCDGKQDCSTGFDERNCNKTHDCFGLLSCLHVPGCYSPWQHCNGIPDCSDGSDEEQCEETQCRPETGGFLCHNFRCVLHSLRCDRVNNCGDESDEQGCLKNSVITAAVLGSLICSLLLVVALGCALRLYRLRLAVAQLALRSNAGGSTGLGRLPIQGRLPPPTYAMAMGFPETPPERLQRQRRRHHRRTRRARPPPPPPPNSDPALPISTAQGIRSNLATPSSRLRRFVRDFWAKPRVQGEERLEDMSCEEVTGSDPIPAREMQVPSALTEVELHAEAEESSGVDDRSVLIEADL